MSYWIPKFIAVMFHCNILIGCCLDCIWHTRKTWVYCPDDGSMWCKITTRSLGHYPGLMFMLLSCHVKTHFKILFDQKCYWKERIMESYKQQYRCGSLINFQWFEKNETQKSGKIRAVKFWWHHDGFPALIGGTSGPE